MSNACMPTDGSSNLSVTSNECKSATLTTLQEPDMRHASQKETTAQLYKTTLPHLHRAPASWSSPSQYPVHCNSQQPTRATDQPYVCFPFPLHPNPLNGTFSFQTDGMLSNCLNMNQRPPVPTIPHAHNTHDPLQGCNGTGSLAPRVPPVQNHISSNYPHPHTVREEQGDSTKNDPTSYTKSLQKNTDNITMAFNGHLNRPQNILPYYAPQVQLKPHTNSVHGLLKCCIAKDALDHKCVQQHLGCKPCSRINPYFPSFMNQPCACRHVCSQSHCGATQPNSAPPYCKLAQGTEQPHDGLVSNPLDSSKSSSTSETCDSPNNHTKTPTTSNDFLHQLSLYHCDAIDDIISSTARDIGLSSSEHAGLKMDLFRNYIRTHEALKDAIRSQQLHHIIHPFLAEILIKNTEDYELQLNLEEIEDAPEVIPNVPKFRHGAIFVNRVVQMSSTEGKILCTYALDVSSKSTYGHLLKKLSQTTGTDRSLLRLVFNEELLELPFDKSLESIGISSGKCVDVYCLTDVFDAKLSTGAILKLRSVPLSTSITSAISKAQKEASYTVRVVTRMFDQQIPQANTEKAVGASVPSSEPRRSSPLDLTQFIDQQNDKGFIPTMFSIEQMAKTYGSQHATVPATPEHLVNRYMRGITKMPQHNTGTVLERGCRSFNDALEEGIITLPTMSFIRSLGFATLSPVQDAAIPLLIQKKRDVLIQACTGSGKTLAFLIPIMEILMKKLDVKYSSKSYCCCVGSLCLAPTRELATQIYTILVDYVAHVNRSVGLKYGRAPFSALLFTGGYNFEKDKEIFCSRNDPWESYTILVATPGRLCTLVENLQLNVEWSLGDIEVLIFDEADRLLVERASFETQLSCILKVLPKQRKTCLISATLSNELVTLLKAGIKNPLLVRVETSGTFLGDSSSLNNNLPSCADVSEASGNAVRRSTRHAIPQGLKNFYCTLPRYAKFAFLLKFLIMHILPNDGRPGKRCILFFLTCSYAQYMYELFRRIKKKNSIFSKTPLICLYGKMAQKHRTTSARRFHNAPSDYGCILFATDVVARGLDFPDVAWILQYDPPTDPTMFVHRIGRAARAGKEGHTLVLLSPSEGAYVPFLNHRQLMLQDFSIDGKQMVNEVVNATVVQYYKEEDIPEELKPGLDEFEQNWSTLPEKDDITSLEISVNDLRASWRLCRSYLLSDKHIILKAAEAFVSFIRAYKENHLQYIFIFKELEIGELAFSLALLRLPRVKEILGKKIDGFYQSSINPKNVVFSDPLKQDKYNQALAIKEEKKTTKNPLPVAKNLVKKRTRSDQRRAQRRRTMEDVEALRRDERLFKKMRKKKITLAEYYRLSKGIAENDENEASCNASSFDTSNTLSDVDTT